jgi:hypothetical protein
MMWSTYPLGTQKGMATGFIVERKDSRSLNGFAPVVVTSLHVLDTIGHRPLVIGARVPNVEGDPEIVIIQIRPPRSSGVFYVRHPSLDVGAFELNIPAAETGMIPMPSFIKEQALTGGRGKLHAGTDVSFLGFPEVVPLTSGIFPILRSGKIASYPAATQNSSGKFIINADVYPGDSGAPVFAAGRSGRPQLVGMIIQRIGRDPRTFAHFAIAVDANAIRETLQLLPQRNAGTYAGRKTKAARQESIAASQLKGGAH